MLGGGGGEERQQADPQGDPAASSSCCVTFSFGDRRRVAQAARTGGAWLTRFQVTRGESVARRTLCPCFSLLRVLPFCLLGPPADTGVPGHPLLAPARAFPRCMACLLPASPEPFPGRPRGLACGLPGAQGALTAAWKSE